MSFYRTFFATIAAIALATPVFADNDNANISANIQLAEATQTHDHAMSSQSVGQAKVNLNMATVKELRKVKGLDASKARAIVAYRKKHGSFKSVADLKSVKGFKHVKSDKMQQITNQLTVE